MPPRYLNIFLKDNIVPEPDDYLGEPVSDEPPPDVPSLAELQEQPDIKFALAVAAKLATII